MTVCIAACLEDSIFLMADGRAIVQGTGEILSNEKNKISKLSENVYCAHFGIIPPIDNTKALINERFLLNAQTPTEAENHLSRAVLRGLSPFLGRFRGTSDALSMLRYGFLFGGFVSNQPFIGGDLWSYTEPYSRCIMTNPTQCTAVGGHDETTRRLFREKAGELTYVGECPSIETCIEAGEYTIRTVQQTFSNVGGTIHYLVLKRNHSIDSGTIPE